MKKLPNLTRAQRYAMQALWEARKPTSGPHLAKLATLGLIARTGKHGAYEPTAYAREVMIARGNINTWYAY